MGGDKQDIEEKKCRLSKIRRRAKSENITITSLSHPSFDKPIKDRAKLDDIILSPLLSGWIKLTEQEAEAHDLKITLKDGEVVYKHMSGRIQKARPYKDLPNRRRRRLTNQALIDRF